MKQINEVLNEKEKQVLILRFGIGGIDPMTLEECGAAFGVTRERIRQIEAKALAKLRRSPATQHLREYIKEN